MAMMVCSSGRSAAFRSCSTYFSKAMVLPLMISLSVAVAEIVFLTGSSVMLFKLVSCVCVPASDASVKRVLIMVASGSLNKVLTKSFVFLMAFAVGDMYFSNRYCGKYIRLLKVPMEALSSSAKFMRISSKDRHASIMVLGLFIC